MRSAKILSALALFSAGLVSADDSCDGLNITSANPTTDCETIDGDVVVGKDVSGTIQLNGVKKIKGDLMINGSDSLTGFRSSDLKEIGGKFLLQDLHLFSDLSVENLQSVSMIHFEKLGQLSKITFGSKGVSKAQNITITDTRLDSLEGLNIAKVGTFEITANSQLRNFKSDLEEIEDSLIFSTNGAAATINMTKLESANTIEVRQIKGLDVPALTSVHRLNFDSNPEMESFKADNLTKVKASLSFINNDKLANFSFAALTEINGDLNIQNNTKLEVIDGLPKLESVFGGVLLAGVFTDIELPKLDHVTGTLKADTTSKEKDFCTYVDGLSDKVDAKESCHYDNENALTGGDGGQESDGKSGGDGKGKDGDSAAGTTSVNAAVLGLTIVGVVAQFL